MHIYIHSQSQSAIPDQSFKAGVSNRIWKGPVCMINLLKRWNQAWLVLDWNESLHPHRTFADKIGHPRSKAYTSRTFFLHVNKHSNAFLSRLSEELKLNSTQNPQFDLSLQHFLFTTEAHYTGNDFLNVWLELPASEASYRVIHSVCSK